VRSAVGPAEDPRVRHYKVQQLSITSRPHMPVLADGVMLDKGPVTAQVHPRALTVITGGKGPGIGD
jgi:diacylglycerol kinase family enzyme